MHGYTSAGIGCSMLPIRFNCPPEIVLIELASSPA
jgi:predicted MPP superfamily phosphohydrolase